MIISCPSKTFLCGEYGVLAGGQALILTHKPHFSLKIVPNQSKLSKRPDWLHPLSPAGKLYEKNKELFADFDFDFFDPYEGRGGFGASGAQFLTLYAFEHQLKDKTIFPGFLHKEFKALDESGSSGCDVLSQWIGGVASVDMSFPQNISRYEWFFRTMEWLVIPTGKKISTHEHLKTVNPSSFEILKEISRSAVEAFSLRREEEFLRAFEDFGKTMEEAGLVTDHSLKIMENLRRTSGVRALKACGALGADTILMLVEKEEVLSIKAGLKMDGILGMDTLQHKNSDLGLRVGSL